MSYTPLLPASVFQGTQFGLVWLGLATAAYIQEGAAKETIIDTIRFAFDPTNNQTYIPNPPDPSNNGQTTLDGYWNVDWGPAITDDNSNLVMLVSFRQGTRPTGNDPQGAPYFFAVAIRGTDTDSDDLALLQQVLQDFNAFSLADLATVFGEPLVPKPGHLVPPLDGGSVSKGTAYAFTRLSWLTNAYTDPSDNSTKTESLAAALLAFTTYYSGVPVVVTGHSLGGCQTQIMAAYLGWQISGTQSALYPNAYAPSTAGNSVFAAYYDKQFPYGNFWLNTLDVVPCGFANLKEILTLWQDFEWPASSINPVTQANISGTPAPTAPAVLPALVATEGMKIDALDYTRPTIGVHVMTGSIPTPQTIEQMLENLNSKNPAQDATTGTSMLMYQHFMEAYNSLVGAVKDVIPYGPVEAGSIPAQLTAEAAQ